MASPDAIAEKARKMALIATYTDKGIGPTVISRKTGIPVGSVTAYLTEMRRSEVALAQTMDPEVLADKKAAIVQGLMHDLREVHAQLAKSKRGYKTVKSTKSGDYEVTVVNEMAVAVLIKQSVDIRMKLAELYGLNKIEMTMTGEIKHVFEVKTNMPLPSAIRELPPASEN